MRNLPNDAKKIAAAAAENGKRTRYTITGVEGLFLECLPDAGRSWFVRYEVGRGRIGRKQHTRRLGSADAKDHDALTFAQARDRAREVRRTAKIDGIDPFAPPPERLTFAELAEAWLEQAKTRKRSWRDDDSRYRMHIAGRLGKKIAEEITRRDITAALDEIEKAVSGVSANRCQAIIGAIFNWAVDDGHLQTSPAVRLRKRGTEKRRNRVLQEDEIRALWAALGTSRVDKRIKLALLLGQRRGEVAAVDPSEFHGREWHIPIDRTKNKTLHILPLSDLAIELFGDCSRVNPTTLTARFIELATELKLQDVRLHDLRHTMKTGLARLGVPSEIADRVTNHLSGRSQRVGDSYNHYDYLDEKRTALELWERRLLEIVEGKKPLGCRWPG